MLVCSVVLRPKRGTVAAAITESATAIDVPSISAVFAILADDPGTASDHLDAFVGKFMVEAASADAVVNAGSIRYAAIVEEAFGVAALLNATVIDSSGGIAAAIAETIAAASAQDADITGAFATSVIDGAFVTSTMASTILGTDVLDSGPTTVFEP